MTTPSQPNREIEEKLRKEMWYLFQDCRSKEVRHSSDCMCMSGEGKRLINFIAQALAEQREKDIELVRNSVVLEKYWEESDEYEQGMEDMKLAAIASIQKNDMDSLFVASKQIIEKIKGIAINQSDA